ncbi:MAG TPA: hypothetical protein VLE70_15605 [Anaerolineae bacterium]|jgi:hypothetical protein|nr:hypothetical protein [Anaerolineae bacterium]
MGAAWQGEIDLLAQAALLDRLSPGWKELVMKEGVWLEDLLRQEVEPAS